MQVVDLNAKSAKKHTADLLEVIDDFRKKTEDGEIQEFVLVSIGKDGEIMLHTVIKDSIGGVGLFEVGKSMLMQQQQMLGIYDN